MKAALAMFKEYPASAGSRCWAICVKLGEIREARLEEVGGEAAGKGVDFLYHLWRNTRPRLPRLPGWRPRAWIPGRRQMLLLAGCSQ